MDVVPGRGNSTPVGFGTGGWAGQPDPAALAPLRTGRAAVAPPRLGGVRGPGDAGGPPAGVHRDRLRRRTSNDVDTAADLTAAADRTASHARAPSGAPGTPGAPGAPGAVASLPAIVRRWLAHPASQDLSAPLSRSIVDPTQPPASDLPALADAARPAAPAGDAVAEVERRLVARLDEWFATELDDHVLQLIDRRLVEESERHSWRHEPEVF